MTRRSGMTLLEVVVALTIAATALAAGASVLGFLSDQAVRGSAETLTSAVNARMALRDWIAGAQLGTSGQVRFIGSTGDDRRPPILDFVTNAATPVAAGGAAMSRIKLTLSGGHQLVASITPWPRGNTVDIVVGDSIAAFRVRYRASLFGPPRWLAAWSADNILPAAVEVRLDKPSGDVLSVPLLVIVGERR